MSRIGMPASARATDAAVIPAHRVPASAQESRFQLESWSEDIAQRVQRIQGIQR